MRTRQKEGDFVQAFVDIYGDWNNDTIKSAIKAALEYEKIDVDCSVEVTIEDEQGIREINKQYRNIDRVTDVLSFPMFEDKSEICVDSSNTAFLGSMVICRQRAEQQAKEYGHSVTREAAFLAVHSTLHLLGYDHEISPEKEREMFEKQDEILNAMGITR